MDYYIPNPKLNPLIEVRDGKLCYYGHWEAKFGYWESQGLHRGLRRIIPDWPLLDIYGEPLNEEKLVRPYSDHLWKERYSDSSIEFMDHLENYLWAIPENVRTIASHFGVYQWMAMQSIWENECLALWLEEEIDAAGTAYVVAVWKFGSMLKLDKVGRARLNYLMTRIPRQTLLSELSEKNVDNVSVRALGRFRGEFAGQELWNFLATTWSSKKKQIISMKKEWNIEEINILAKIPDWLALPNVMEALFENVNIHHLSLSEPVSRIVLEAPEEERFRIVSSLRGLRSWEELDERLKRWEVRLALRMEFPSPPDMAFAYSHLIPLTSGAALAKEGKLMKNCLANLAPEVVYGQSYFFQWTEGERLTIQLKRSEDGKWRLHEHLGYKNEYPSEQTVHLITNVVSRILGERDIDKDYVYYRTVHTAGMSYYQPQRFLQALNVDEEVDLRREPGNRYDTNAIEIYTLDEE